VEAQRNQARRARQRADLPVVALIGYTNAGKSTLFNALTGAHAYAADQLFATLDPTLRRLDGLACGPVLLADTVGFVRDLPHDLVAAFRATLAEARDADLLLHVVDAADPERDARRADVERVLAEIGAGELPQLLVYNKIDRVEGALPRIDRIDGSASRVGLSALTGAGIDLLRPAIGERLSATRLSAVLHVPAAHGRLRARLHEQGMVVGETPDESGWRMEIEAPRERIEPLFGLPGGDGAWLRGALLAATSPATYNRDASEYGAIAS
jgi:GTP-binding protein HflX